MGTPKNPGHDHLCDRAGRMRCVGKREGQTDLESAAWIGSAATRRGGGHLSPFASSMIGVLRTRGW